MLARRSVLLAAFALALSIGLVSLRLLSADDEPQPRKLAFLVGVKKYSHGELKDLEFPENDVKDLAEVLKRLGFTVTVMSTSAGRSDKEHYPDADNIRQQLTATLKGATKDDLILVGLAGHGLQPLNSSQSYFCPHDANPAEKNGDVAHPETLLSLGEILTQIRDSGIGHKLLLVDACRNDPEVRGGRRGAGTIQVDVSALPQQTGVLLSCAHGEFSFESKAFGSGHGAFFYQVIEGLKGEAGDRDGEVTWDSLRAYVKKHVPSTVRKIFGKDGGDQHPNEIGNLTGEPTVLAIAGHPSGREELTSTAQTRTMVPSSSNGAEPDYDQKKRRIEKPDDPDPANAKDPFQPNSVWMGGTSKLTVTEREGASFRARFEIGQNIDREIKGTVRAGKVRWFARDVRAVRGKVGGDNTGTIMSDERGDRIDFIHSRQGKKEGEFTLWLQK
jgi:Caspase domain